MVDEAAVPAVRTLEEPRRRLVSRIGEHRRLVDRAIDGAGLETDDERDRLAFVRRRRGEVRRIVLQVAQPLPALRSRQVEVVDARRDRAIGVKRRAERPRSVGKAERLCFADERRFLRT